MAQKDADELSRELGERGDLVACLTSQIGVALVQGEKVQEDDVVELEQAMNDIEDLVAAADTVDRTDLMRDDAARAD